MPPKKKPITKPAITAAEKKEVPQPLETETLTNRPEILKKPFFRTARFYSLDTIQRMQIKLWKLKSWHLGREKDFMPVLESKNRAKQIIKSLSSPTLRKSLKGIKNFDFRENFGIKIRDLKGVFPYLSKADSLALSANHKNTLARVFLKRYLNPHLKHLNLSSIYFSVFEEADKFFRKICKDVNKLKKCMSKFQICNANVGVKWPISFSKVPSEKDQNRLLTPLTLSLRDSIQELSLSCNVYGQKDKKIEILQDIQFPNLKKFTFCVRTSWGGEGDVYLSFLKNSPNLEILHLDQEGQCAQIGSLDFLMSLTKLRDLSLGTTTRRDNLIHLEFPNLPCLTTLERLKTPFGITNMQSVIQLMQKNINLKTLEMTLNIEKMIEIFTEDVEVGHVQNISLEILGISQTDSKQIKAFQTSLLCFKHVQKLVLEFSAFYVSCLHPTLKTLEQFSNLEELSLSALNSGEMEDKKFAKFKDLFKKIPHLKSLELDLKPDLMNSRELSSLVDALAFLANLKAFTFRASLVKITSSTLSKFANFLSSHQTLREIYLQIKGLDEEETELLWEISSRGRQLFELMIPEKKRYFSSF